MNKTSKYRIWWIPQVPGPTFYHEVKTLREGKTLYEALAFYDLFQFKNKIKGDYANTGGLQEFLDDEGWCDWMDEKTGKEISEIEYDELPTENPIQPIVQPIVSSGSIPDITFPIVLSSTKYVPFNPETRTGN
jgi:hypothetical protein